MDWDEHFPTVAFVYRTSVNDGAADTPFYITFGREARIPADLCFGPPLDEPQEQNNYIPFVEQLQTGLRDAYHLVRRNLNRCAIRRQATYNLRTRVVTYAAGFRVRCLVPRRRQHGYQKWASLYQGPFRVIRTIGPVNVELQRSARTRPFIVHVDKLKPCHSYGEVTHYDDSSTYPNSDSDPAFNRSRRIIRRPARFND